MTLMKEGNPSLSHMVILEIAKHDFFTQEKTIFFHIQFTQKKGKPFNLFFYFLTQELLRILSLKTCQWGLWKEG